jgi:hypothetical protein
MASKVIITVERPDGTIDRVEKHYLEEGYGIFRSAAEGNRVHRERIASATAQAGKGTVISYELVLLEDEPVTYSSPREERAALVASINAILAVQEDARSAWFDSESPVGALPNYDTPEYHEAEAALAAFDAAHPDIVEQLKAEKAEMVNRHMWD